MVDFHYNFTALVDVRIASQNAQTAAADYTIGQANAARIIDKRRAYHRDFETINHNVNLVIFAVEDFGAVHPEAPWTTCCPRQSWQRAEPFSFLPLCIHSSCSYKVRRIRSRPPLSWYLTATALHHWYPPRPSTSIASTWCSPLPLCCNATLLTRTPCLSDPVDLTYHISNIRSQHNQW
jgi:hypothetical protein